MKISQDDFKLIKTFYPEFKRSEGIRSNGYFIDWNEIMPVVEKIEKLGYEVVISSQMETVDDDRNLIWHQDVNIGDGLIEITETHSESKIESTYMAIVEFIKWYNSQPPHP